jgi:hypothetical protein
MVTGCSAENRMTTAAIVSASAPGQMPAALEMASRVLRPASQINNAAHLVCFGTSLSQSRVRKDSLQAVQYLNEVVQKETDAISGIKLDGFHLVVGPSDLHLIQFVPNASFGQLCEVTDKYDDIQGIVDCLARPMGKDLNDIDALPYNWAEHQHNINFITYFRDLWKQTIEVERKKDEPDAILMARIPNPKPALVLAMFAKTASIATNVCELSLSLMTSTVAATKGAEALGLMDMFSQPMGEDALNAQEFLKQYLVGDDAPWAVNQRGQYAAAAAENVLSRIFSHSKQVAELASKAKLVDTIPSKNNAKDGLLVMDCSKNGNCARLITGRVPASARAVEGKLQIDFEESSDNWIDSVNKKLFTAIDMLLNSSKQEISVEFSLFTALSSSHLLIPDDLMDADLDNLILKSSGARDLVTTTSTGLVGHVFNELTIKEDRIERAASGAHVLVQRGPSVSCTFATFCPTTAKSLETKEFDPASLSDLDISGIQYELNSIATSIDRPYRPLGSLVGLLGGEIEFNGKRRRLAYWRRRNETRDSIITFLPAEYVDIAFSDYATGSRKLLRSETARGNDARPPATPLFAADSIFSISTASSLRESNGLAFSIPAPEKAGFLGADEKELYSSYARAATSSPTPNSELPSSLGGSFLSFYVRESANDPISGLRVGWARTSARSGELFTLVSDNAEFQRVAF